MHVADVEITTGETRHDPVTERPPLRRVSGRPEGNGPLAALHREIWLWAKSGTRQWRRALWAERMPLLPDSFKYRYWLVERPNYAYGVHLAAMEAYRLGLDAVTVVEFGVAGGNGLLALERHAAYIGAAYGIRVDVVGFDSGSGLPDAADRRDLPYRWSAGFYAMDEDALRRRLASSTLVLGDVADTVPAWISENRKALAQAPVGFVSFDLDYYSSTMASFELFRSADCSHLLPRVTCWLDDIVYGIPGIGELQAVSDFNAEAPDERSMGPIVGLRAGIPFDPPWADQIFETHFFKHPRYGSTIEEVLSQLQLS